MAFAQWARLAVVPSLKFATTLLTILLPVYGQYPAIRDCSSLRPTSCQGRPIIQADTGKFSFTDYQEDCTGVTCINPVSGPGWFCGTDVLTYPARVAAATGLPAGKAEDNYAACLYNNWNFALLQDNCRDIQLWSCNDCRAAYRSWLCSQIFTRCNSGDPLQRVKTCHDECFRVIQRCPATQQFACPLTDPRDYIDGFGMPLCNNVSSTVVV